MNRKGIILAGGSGTRLYPLTRVVSKQLLPVYDKPMIYYPLSTLMQAGISEIQIITTPHEQSMFRDLLDDGSQWGLKLDYAVQEKPEGLAQALMIAEDFLDGHPSCLILGDNLFFGQGLPNLLKDSAALTSGAEIYAYHVNDPERYGVVSFDGQGMPQQIVEKPKTPQSNWDRIETTCHWPATSGARLCSHGFGRERWPCP